MDKGLIRSAGYLGIMAITSISTSMFGLASEAGCMKVLAGGYHTVGLKPDGTVVAVGGNDIYHCQL